MKSLIDFFQDLRGEHLAKASKSENRVLVAGSIDGIDCCDVTDTCCDSYD